MASTSAPLFSKDDATSIKCCLWVALLAFLQGLDGAEIGGFTAMNGFLQDYGYYDESIKAWNIRPSIQTLITCLLSLGAAIGSILAGPIGTKFGQKIGLMICATSSITGTAIQTGATTLPGLVVGRIFVGCGIGMATNFILVYQSEISPRRLRGVLLGTFSLTVNLGSFVGTCVNQGTYQMTSRWCYRIPLLTQLVCPIIFLCGAWLLPNSPRFLVSRGRTEEAYEAHRRLFGTSPETAERREQEMKEIIAFVEFEKQTQRSTTFIDCFRGTDLRRTLIAIGLMTSQNFAGRDFLSTYGTYFFKVAGVSQPFLISVITNLVNLLVTLLAFPLVAYVDRRKILLPSIGSFTICLFVFASVGTALPNSVAASKTLVVFMILYSMTFQLSMGVLASTLVSESASTRLRSNAQSVTVFTAWTEAIVWTVVLPYLINPSAANLGAKIGFMYGGFGIFIFLFVFFCLPEYRNRSLEELDEMFMKRVPARQFKTFVTNGIVDGHTIDEKAAMVTGVQAVEDVTHISDKA